MKIRPVILSGGSGTRLWPVSRVKSPKQFIPLMDGECLLTQTLRSVADRDLFLPPTIVGNAEHVFLIRDALAEAGVTSSQTILEPVGRNTAAAVLCAALLEKDPDVLHLVRPSDHVVGDLKAWHAALAQGCAAAADGYLVLFGIEPDRPETGYGYICRGETAGFENVYRIASFKEKPDVEAAKAMIARGALWNSGIFLFSPRTLIEEAEKVAPELLRDVRNAVEKATDAAGQGILPDPKLYAAVQSEPFDRAVMERTTRGAVVPCQMGWNDVGSWRALWDTERKNGDGNVLLGSVVAVDTANSYVRSDGPALAVLGVKDIAVVATKDAVLVTPLENTQQVKELVRAVGEAIPDLAIVHPMVRRPWGRFESLSKGARFQVKLITVRSGQSLSLQLHRHRSEHWVVVAGEAIVECGDVKKTLRANESIYIPKGEKHRLTNPGPVDLQIVEVQSGDYLGEDDIVRFVDDYGRTDS